jgi:hypothetical protein
MGLEHDPLVRGYLDVVDRDILDEQKDPGRQVGFRPDTLMGRDASATFIMGSPA